MPDPQVNLDDDWQALGQPSPLQRGVKQVVKEAPQKKHDPPSTVPEPLLEVGPTISRPVHGRHPPGEMRGKISSLLAKTPGLTPSELSVLMPEFSKASLSTTITIMFNQKKVTRIEYGQSFKYFLPGIQ